MTKLKKMRTLVQCLSVLAIVCMVFAGCGKAENTGADDAKPVKKAAKGDPAAEKKAPEPVGLKAPEGAPASVAVLQLMPESAMIAMAVPSVDALVAKGVGFAKRVAPEGVDIDAIVADTVAGMAEDAGVADAKTFNDIAAAKGVDLSLPVGFFIDLTPMEAKLGEAAEALKAEAAANAGATAVDSTATFDQMEKMNEVMAGMDVPAMIGVVSCKDLALAEQTLKDILASEGSPLAGVEPVAKEAQGVTIQSYNDGQFAYFTASNVIVAGSSVTMLEEAAARLQKPAEIRYGSAACPAGAPDELVELIRLDKLMPFVTKLMPVLAAMDPAAGAMLDAQMMMMTSSMDAYSGADPAVATLAMDDQKIDFVTRIDTSTHPNVLKASGAAMPLRLATLLPDSTELFMTMRFNPELKTAIQTQWMTALPPDVVPPNVAPMMQQAMTMIGDELTIALTGMEGLIPKAVIMMGMADPVNTKALLQMLIPMQPGEQHNGVDIMSMAVPLPVSLSIAFPGDIMMVSTDVTAMKGIIDLIQAGQKSTLFGAMQPAMDDALPRYSALVLKTGMIGQVVQQVAPLAGGLPPEATMVLDAFTSIVRELRMTQEMNGTWMDSKFSIYLNDPAAAPAPAPAAAAPAAEAAPAAAPAEAPAAK